MQIVKLIAINRVIMLILLSIEMDQFITTVTYAIVATYHMDSWIIIIMII